MIFTDIDGKIVSSYLIVILADIGGNMGLCIGGSFISILELIEFLVLLCTNCCRGAGKSRVKPRKDQWADPAEKPPPPESAIYSSPFRRSTYNNRIANTLNSTH